MTEEENLSYTIARNPYLVHLYYGILVFIN